MSDDTVFWTTIATNLKAAITRLSSMELSEISLDGRTFKYRDLPYLRNELRIAETKADIRTVPPKIVEAKRYLKFTIRCYTTR